MVKVLVGERPEPGEEFSGGWAEFEGTEVGAYEDEGIVYTLYLCTAYDFKAYRVHVAGQDRNVARCGLVLGSARRTPTGKRFKQLGCNQGVRRASDGGAQQPTVNT